MFQFSYRLESHILVMFFAYLTDITLMSVFQNAYIYICVYVVNDFARAPKPMAFMHVNNLLLHKIVFVR